MVRRRSSRHSAPTGTRSVFSTDYLHDERPQAAAADRLFVVLKGPRRGLPLSAEGPDDTLSGARSRTGLDHATCHELRHTCLARLQEADMALEAVQARPRPVRPLRCLDAG
jgi:integrase/recombinase XerD